jgi:hypothetical protein
MSTNTIWKASLAFVVVLLLAAAGVGWVMNIATLFVYYNFMAIGELLLRLVGIFFLPIGGVMGYL